MIDLEKLREKTKECYGVVMIGESEFIALLDYATQLEKDAGRLDWMVNEQVFMQYERDNYWLVFPDGSYQVSSHNSPRQAIDTAMESKHG